jgi:hypothetical protein
LQSTLASTNRKNLNQNICMTAMKTYWNRYKTVVPHAGLSSIVGLVLGGMVNLGMAAPVAAVGFTGDYDQNNWVTTYGGSLAGDSSDGSLDASLAPSSMIVGGPINQTNAPSYVNWSITMPGSGLVYGVSFAWSFTSDDSIANDDKGYYVINSTAVLLASWNAQFDGNSAPIPLTGTKTIVLNSGDTLRFRVASSQNRINNDPDYDQPGYLAISNFDVQTAIPFNFDPRGGIICLSVLGGIYQWWKTYRRYPIN